MKINLGAIKKRRAVVAAGDGRDEFNRHALDDIDDLLELVQELEKEKKKLAEELAIAYERIGDLDYDLSEAYRARN